MSEVRATGALSDFCWMGKRESDSEILNKLLDQWIVRNEAQVARFPQPSEDEVNRQPGAPEAFLFLS